MMISHLSAHVGTLEFREELEALYANSAVLPQESLSVPILSMYGFITILLIMAVVYQITHRMPIARANPG
jgi:hypothetical protein